MIASPAQAETVRLDQYLAALERIDSLLASNQLQAAREDARRLSSLEVAWSGGKFHADEVLLTAIAEGGSPDRDLRARLRSLIDELRQNTPHESAPADPKLLEQVVAEQKVPELKAGGNIQTYPDANAPLIERVAKGIASAWKWLGEKFSALIDWLLDFFPSSKTERAPTAGLRWIVTAVVGLILLTIVILAIEVTRRALRGKAEPVAASEPAASQRDEDPMSRETSEWERYAVQLAEAGRLREAIRAWYHAVLVACYAGGVLHFRKGKTNWEYIATMPPSVLWRAEFIRLTQRFEQEWYGLDQSSAEALDECSRRARRILDALRRTAKGAA